MGGDCVKIQSNLCNQVGLHIKSNKLRSSLMFVCLGDASSLYIHDLLMKVRTYGRHKRKVTLVLLTTIGMVYVFTLNPQPNRSEYKVNYSSMRCKQKIHNIEIICVEAIDKVDIINRSSLVMISFVFRHVLSLYDYYKWQPYPTHRAGHFIEVAMVVFGYLSCHNTDTYTSSNKKKTKHRLCIICSLGN